MNRNPFAAIAIMRLAREEALRRDRAKAAEPKAAEPQPDDPAPPVLGARFNRAWVALWVASCAVLAWAVTWATPVQWCALAFVLFILPEMVGLRVRGDALPPLTYAVRRFVPRWIPTAVTWAVAAWMAMTWAPQADHPAVVVVACAFVAGWLTNHWDVTYDGPGE